MKTLIAILLTCFIPAAAAEVKLIIPNQLGHEWPGELVSFDLGNGKVPSGDLSMEVQGTTRPAQVDEEGRVWSYVTIAGKGEEIGTVPAVLKQEKVQAGITWKKQDGFYLIDNGTYEFKLRDYKGDLDSPVELGKFPHWCGGMKSKEQKKWDGAGWFESNAPVIGATTELINSGPVFLDFKITYRFEGEADGETEAMPLALGKQAHLFKPNVLPRETVPKLENSYELLIRFVMDDIWIDVNERFHFPKDEKASNYGISHYYLGWGDHMPVDTVSWVRWFEYDSFGGNTSQNYIPAKPRPAQKGRPFALLRPRWNQGGGGAQDFVLTSGGAPPGKNSEAGKGYSPENPAVGVIAAYASKWVGPYANYIPVYALNGDSGKARFPMVDGERSGLHYGQRAFGLLVGPRSRMTDLNGIVRRHTDWTLTAQVNKYILEWKRDPKKAGPNILLNRNRLAVLQAEYKSGDDTPVNEALKAKAEEWQPLIDERDKLLAEFEERDLAIAGKLDELRPKAKERDAPKEIKAKFKELENARKTNSNEWKKNKRMKEISNKLKGTDFDLYQLITTGTSGLVDMPDSGLWRARRYQDDFLNPTSSPTRKLPEFATADLFANGRPLGGASQAAMGYIATDLDAWPGYHQGWSPGNPNFHTDKYMAAIFVGGSMLDHPHSKEWLNFGLQNFKEDTGKVLLEPDGVGAECPGYAGYATKLQMEIARILMNTGEGNLLAENPLVKATGIWHRKLITPYDFRINRRHEAPIGDTHRWDSGLYPEGFAKLAAFFKESDPAFASEMMGTYDLLKKSKNAEVKDRKEIDLKEAVVSIDGTIPRADPTKMDWSSQAFGGFGAVMRDGFGTKGESFVSFKAGRARGHYHNDENSYHFYSGGTPISLDYNCSYDPRGDHAALHNSMTFGKSSQLKHNGDGRSIDAQEEITSSSKVVRFVTTPGADLIVAERTADSVVLRPVYPRDNEFGRDYPSREVAPITHRRELVFVKNEEGGSLGDYLVVRDSTTSTEPQQLNIHLLAREISEEGNLFSATGQWDKDMLVFLADATEPKTTVGGWHYSDEWMLGPDEYTLRENETQAQWKDRMAALMKKNDAKSLPLPGWKPQWLDPKDEAQQKWQATLAATKGEAMMPPPFWSGSWMYGEYQKWLRIETKPGTPITWVLYPYEKGTEPPTIERTETGVKISSGKATDEINFSEGGNVTLSRDGKLTELK